MFALLLLVAKRAQDPVVSSLNKAISHGIISNLNFKRFSARTLYEISIEFKPTLDVQELGERSRPSCTKNCYDLDYSSAFGNLNLGEFTYSG